VRSFTGSPRSDFSYSCRRGSSCCKHRVPVDDPVLVRRQPPRHRASCRWPSRHVAAVGTAGDADALGVDVAVAARNFAAKTSSWRSPPRGPGNSWLEGHAIAVEPRTFGAITCSRARRARSVAAERVDGLAGRTAVRKDDARVLAVAVEIEWNQSSALIVARQALVMDDLRRGQCSRGDAAIGSGYCDASRSRGRRPTGRPAGRGLVRDEQPVAARTERRRTARRAR